MLQCVAVRCSALAVRCSVLQCVVFPKLLGRWSGQDISNDISNDTSNSYSHPPSPPPPHTNTRVCRINSEYKEMPNQAKIQSDGNRCVSVCASVWVVVLSSFSRSVVCAQLCSGATRHALDACFIDVCHRLQLPPNQIPASQLYHRGTYTHMMHVRGSNNERPRVDCHAPPLPFRPSCAIV